MTETTLSIALAGDFHLGTPFAFVGAEKAERLQRFQEQALRDLCQYCERHQVRYLFLAGDIFDGIYTDHALLRRTQQSFSLCRGTRVLIVPGNHDPHLPGNYWEDRNWPQHVTIFKEGMTVKEFPDDRLRVYGAPFLSQSASQSILEILDPPVESDYLNILLLHGELVPAGKASRYNPIPVEWLERSGLDLAVLGHIHQSSGLVREAGGTSYIYPGCLMGRGFDECGDKGFYSGHIRKNFLHMYPSGTHIDLHFIASAPVQFQRLRLRPADFEAENQEELFHVIEDELKRNVGVSPEKNARLLIELSLDGPSELVPDTDYLRRKLEDHYFKLNIRDNSYRPLNLQHHPGDKSLSAYIAAGLTRLRENGGKDVWNAYNDHGPAEAWDEARRERVLKESERLLSEALSGEVRIDAFD